MMTREQAFEKVLDACGCVDRKQTLEAFELLARGAEPERVVEAIESLRHGYDLLLYIDSELQESEYEAKFGPRLVGVGRRY